MNKINQTIVLHDKPAIKIKAFAVIPSPKGKSTLYNCEGNKVWIPDTLCKFDANKKELVIEQWFYDKLINDKLL